MPIPTDYVKLLDDLLAKSREGKVEWRESKSTPENFYLAFSKFALEICSGADEQTERPYVAVILRNSEGDRLDSFFLDHGEPDYGMLSELHSLALRKARRIDEALAELRAELESEAPGANTEPPPTKLPF